MTETIPLTLGADVIDMLLPHKSPFLLVDGVTEYTRSPLPRLRSYKMISANEQVFDGHFPGLKLWPGVYTIEGMGQTTALLMLISGCQDGFEKAGRDPNDVIIGLQDLQRIRTLQPGGQIANAKEVLDVLEDPTSPFGFSAAVNVKLFKPILAGCRLDFLVTLERTISHMAKFSVEAEVNGQLVASGTMTNAMHQVTRELLS
jgi:3-hydroxyacyl-[acyl-carrier-protein] dehydratase